MMWPTSVAPGWPHRQHTSEAASTWERTLRHGRPLALCRDIVRLRLVVVAEPEPLGVEPGVAGAGTEMLRPAMCLPGFPAPRADPRQPWIG